MRIRLIVVSSMLFLGVAAAVPKLSYQLAGLDNDVLTGGGSGMRVSVRDTAPRTATYRPCRSRADDRCIQTNERSVRMARAVAPPVPPARIAATARPVPRPAQRRVQTAALAPPPGPPVAYAGCTTLLTDDCVAAFDRIRSRAPAPRAVPAQRRQSGTLETPGI